jgi:hypothetical protein
MRDVTCVRIVDAFVARSSATEMIDDLFDREGAVGRTSRQLLGGRQDLIASRHRFGVGPSRRVATLKPQSLGMRLTAA